MPNYMTELSPDNNTHVYQIKDKEAAPIDLLKDTVGWSGMNKAKSYKVETFTEQYYRALNIDVDLQPSTSYILSLDTDNSGNRYYANDTIFNGIDPITADGTRKVVTLTTKSTLDTSQYNLANGGWYVLKNYTAQSSAPSFTNVMITDSSVIDTSYEPYHESVESVLETKGDWDARNISVLYPYGLQGSDIDGYCFADASGTDGRSIVAKIESGKTYTITKKNGVGNRFCVVGMNNVPKYGSANYQPGTQIYSLDSGSNYEYTSDGTYQYLFVGLNANSNSLSGADIEGMIQLASNANKDYTEHREPLDIVIPSKMSYADNGVLGAKNLLSKGWVTQTVQGATFTANSDGSVTVDTNGVATTGSAIISKEYTFKAGDKFILSGCPEGGSDNTYRVDITATGFGANDYGEGVAVIIPSDGTYNVRIRVASGATVNNLTFYPMLRLESDPDDTYVPYAMTNREITEELTVQESAVTDIVSGASISNNHNNLYKQGKFVHMCIEIAHVTATAYDTIIAKVPSNYKPRTFTVDCNMSNTQIARIYVDNNGNVKSRNALSDASFVATATWITS